MPTPDRPLRSRDGFVALTSFADADLQPLREVLARSYTDPVHGWRMWNCDTADDLVNLLASAQTGAAGAFWLLTCGTQVAGLAGVQKYRGVRETLSTTSYLDPSVRGIGVNRTIKSLFAAAASRARVQLVATVALENNRSNAAMRNLLGASVKPQTVSEGWREPEEAALLYTLPACIPDTPEIWDDEAVESCARAFRALVWPFTMAA